MTSTARRILPAAALLAALLLLHATPAAARSGGSVYSRFGVGDLRTSATVPFLGLGGTGVALRPAGTVNDLNPAAWSGLGRVRFSVSALYEGFSSDDGFASGYFAGTTFNGLGLVIPFDSARGLSFGAILAPYSRVRYAVTGPVSQGGLDYTLTRTGSGGISRATAGLAARVLPRLNAAAGVTYYFGTIRHAMNQSFGGATYAGASLDRTESVRGGGLVLALLHDVIVPAPGDDGGAGLTAGLVLATTAWPTVRSERVYNYGAAVSTNPRDTIDGGERSMRLPLSIAAGAAWRTGGTALAADVRFQDWEDVPFETAPGVRLRGRVRASAGAEFTRGAGRGVNPARLTTWSAGLFYDTGYLEAAGERIGESGVTAGIAFPILGETRLALAAGFSLRGSAGSPLQEEKIFRLSASLDVAELWFQRPEEE